MLHVQAGLQVGVCAHPSLVKHKQHLLLSRKEVVHLAGVSEKQCQGCNNLAPLVWAQTYHQVNLVMRKCTLGMVLVHVAYIGSINDDVDVPKRSQEHLKLQRRSSHVSEPVPTLAYETTHLDKLSYTVRRCTSQVACLLRKCLGLVRRQLH